MTKKKKEVQKKTTVAWKSGKGWVMYNPPKHHPSSDEWHKYLNGHK
jgi:hypothetical protein